MLITFFVNFFEDISGTTIFLNISSFCVAIDTLACVFSSCNRVIQWLQKAKVRTRLWKTAYLFGGLHQFYF